MDWPFKDMAVGDRVAITDNIDRAQAYVHVYAKQSGKRFKTRRFTLEDGTVVLGVKRVEGEGSTPATDSGEKRRTWPFKRLRVGEAADIPDASLAMVSQRASVYGRLSDKRFEAIQHGAVVRVTRTG